MSRRHLCFMDTDREISKVYRQEARVIPINKWKWFGNAGHFILGHECRFHICTLIGNTLVSTVGQYWPPESVREIIAKSRKIKVVRENDFMRKIGYQDIGHKRKFETMAFKITKKKCTRNACGCGMPEINASKSVAFAGYNTAGAAAKGHMIICHEVAQQKHHKKEKKK